ncbi:MAG: lysophospholipid acyltransferase family protein [Thermoanaerobaculia bacterium]
MSKVQAVSRRGGDQPPAVLGRYSPLLVGLFTSWLEGYFRKAFDGVRLSREGSHPHVPPGPLLVYSNHPSWWDPIHFLLIGRFALSGRRVFGPMEAEALKKYKFFSRMGVYGVDTASRRGAADFLRTSRAVLADPKASLWVTAQGEFCDPRQRPVTLRRGVAHLASRMTGGTILPLALEYPFWNERLPEALSRFGRPIDLATEPRRSASEWNSFLEVRLEETMDTLGRDASARNPDRFHTLFLGRAGVGGVYDRWRRLKSVFDGRSLDVAHEEDRR